jgi:hypothetical protein
MRKVTLLASVFLMLAAVPGATLDLPPAPKGFSWIKLPGWDSETGPMVAYGCQVRSKEKPPPPIIMHVLVIANTRTNRLYVYIFKSPEKQWPAAWKLGEQIMDLLVLDDEF